jgi:hypothetical protein
MELNRTTAEQINQPRSPRALRGWARKMELAREDEAARQAEVVRLTADLGRKPVGGERVLIEDIARLAVRGRRLSQYGRHREALEVSRLLTRAVRTLGLPAPSGGAASPAGRRLDAHLAALAAGGGS